MKHLFTPLTLALIALVTVLVLKTLMPGETKSDLTEARHNLATLCDAIGQLQFDQAQLYDEMVPVLEEYDNKHSDKRNERFYVPIAFVPGPCRDMIPPLAEP